MKIFDCFCMFQELDVVELRLHELYNVVDHFIIHESTRTHTGNSKPLYFAENRKRFEQFEDKIIYRCIDDTPDYFINLNVQIAKDELQKIVFEKINGDTFWDKNHLPYSRDAYEKESIIRSMGNLNDDDIVMFSDADEIPNALIVAAIKDIFDEDQIYNLEQNHFWFYLNCMRNDKWIGNTLLSFKNFKQHSVCSLRKNRTGLLVKDAGWHFSFMGGGAGVKQKVQSYGEQSINQNYVTQDTDDFIEDCIRNNHDFYMHSCRFNIIPVNYNNHPRYLVDNQDKFAKHIRSLV